MREIHRSTQTIAEFCEFIDSGRPIKKNCDGEGIPAYEVGHIEPGRLKPTSVIAPSDSDRILLRHDILTGRVGGLGCFAEYSSDAPASFSDNTLRLRPKADQRHHSAFVTAFLNSSVGNTQLIRDSRGGLQKVVTQQSLGEIVFPNLGAAEKTLVAELEAARNERDQALVEAERLFLSIDDLVKERLGLHEKPRQHSNSFAIRLGVAKAAGTLSPDFFHPERTRAILQIRKLRHEALRYLVSFQRNIVRTPDTSRYIGLASVASNTGQLTGAVESASGPCFEFEEHDVLYGRLRPYLNKVWLAAFEGVCSTEFHVMRSRDPKELNPAYLSVVLRTGLIVGQTKHMMTGNTHPRITNEDVGNLLIPLAGEEIQSEIVNATHDRQREAIRLRIHAATVWAEARARFERQLLNGKTL